MLEGHVALFTGDFFRLSNPSLQFFRLLFQFLLGWVMLIAGVKKMISRSDFERTLRYTFGTPRRFSVSLAVLLPILESLLGIAFIFLVETRIAAALTGLMLLVFSGKLMRLRLAGIRSIECNCFGSDHDELPISTLLGRNLVLILLAVMLFIAPPDPALWPAEHPVVYVVEAAMTAVSLMLIFSIINRGMQLYKGIASMNK